MTQLYHAQRESLEKYGYFLLAAAGAAIAFAVTQTRSDALAWPHLLVGLAILCWAISFVFGCRFLEKGMATLRLNMDLIRVQQGQHELSGRDPHKMAAGHKALNEFMDRARDQQAFAFRWQYSMLIAGAAFYVAWQVLEMAIRAGLA